MTRRWLSYGIAGLVFSHILFEAGTVSALDDFLSALPSFNSSGSQTWHLKLAQSTQSDQLFIISMMPYQADAIASAELALTRAKRPEVKALARTIKTSQTQVNHQLRTWYVAWYGEAVPDGLAWQRANGTSSLGMGGGMLPDLSSLNTASDFDRAFLEEMMARYQMGVLMAQAVVNDSDRPELQELAKALIQANSAKIDEMQYWYWHWYVQRPSQFSYHSDT